MGIACNFNGLLVLDGPFKNFVQQRADLLVIKNGSHKELKMGRQNPVFCLFFTNSRLYSSNGCLWATLDSHDFVKRHSVCTSRVAYTTREASRRFGKLARQPFKYAFHTKSQGVVH